jgi:arginine metabolism regulation protein II
MPSEAGDEERGSLDSEPATGSSSSYDWLQSQNISASDLSLYTAPALNRFLMRHYAERVCRLFCAMDTPKSPWKTIHLPRALQAMGELSVTGKTSRVRNALLNALLSISAWYMSNDHQRHNANDQADRWAEAAARYGFDAISLLKQAVDTDLHGEPRPKYKDFLATMLSMITVNVSAPQDPGLSMYHAYISLPGHVGGHEHMWRAS